MTDDNIQESVDLLDWTVKNLPIRFFGDEVLKDSCKAIHKHEFGTPELQEAIDMLQGTLDKYRQHTGMGRGIAANQIGISKRIIVVWLKDKPEVMINPKLVSSEGVGSYWESCISSGTLLIGQIHRPWQGVFAYQDFEGKPHKLTADEKGTRVILHEINHLKGITCNEKYLPKTLRFICGGKKEIMGYPLVRIS
jgi:peptide deformylase